MFLRGEPCAKSRLKQNHICRLWKHLITTHIYVFNLTFAIWLRITEHLPPHNSHKASIKDYVCYVCHSHAFNSDTKNRISFPAWFLDDWPTPILIQYNLFSSADDKTQPTLVLLYDYRSVHSVPTLIRTVKYKITLQALRKCVGACVRKNVLKIFDN